MSIVAAIIAEIERLEDELHADPRHRKLEKLRATLAEYQPTNNLPGTPAPRPRVSNGHGDEAAMAAPGSAAMSKAARMEMEITKVLEQKRTVHRKELLNHLIAREIMGKETDPMQALAIFLSSHKEQFESDGAGNFSIRKP